MQQERKDSPERQQLFRAWCTSNGIKRFLLDLDDTISLTRAVFGKVINEACAFLALEASFLPSDTWHDEIRSTINKVFEEKGVNPNIWDLVMDELTAKHSLAIAVDREVRRVFRSIYTTPLAMLDGAAEGLAFIKNSGVPLGIVTHANSDWTMRKYDWLDLGRFVTKDEIFIVSEDGHKTSESWQQAVSYFGHQPHECAVVGDSPRSDINPACQIGVRHCFLVEDPNQWSLHNQEVNLSVKKIRRLDEIPKAILDNL